MLVTGEKSPICLEEGLNPAADNYFYLPDVYSLCLEEVNIMGKPFLRGNLNPMKDPEIAKKSSESHKGQIPWNKGKKGVMPVPWNKGRPMSEELKKKVSEAKIGKSATWNKGRVFSEEHRKKLSDAKKDKPSVKKGRLYPHLSGENNPNWRGGHKIAVIRGRNKRQNLNLGFNPLNEFFDGSEAHHLDKSNVLYIPKDIHQSIKHQLGTSRNMDKINILAFDWWQSSVL